MPFLFSRTPPLTFTQILPSILLRRKYVIIIIHHLFLLLLRRIRAEVEFPGAEALRSHFSALDPFIYFALL